MFGFLGAKKSIPHAMSIVELSVHVDCDGCEKRVRKVIKKLDGVDSVEIDMDNQKVTVNGYMDQRKVFKAVRRTGRKAEFWPYPSDGEYYTFAFQYLEDSTYSSNHNYYQRGYTSTVHGYFPDAAYSTVEHFIALFNNENVHACVIMEKL